MDAPSQRGATAAARTTTRSGADRPARSRPAGPPDDEREERDDGETYAVLGED